MQFVIYYSRSDRIRVGIAYHALHIADEQTIEDFTSLIGVTNILKGLGAVLATDVEKNFLATAVESLLAICLVRGRVWRGDCVGRLA